MNYLDRLAEAHIRTAAEHGVFDNLRGAGKPLPPDEAQHVPRELRAGYRMLKNAGFVPPEVEQAKDIHDLRDLLASVDPDTAQAHATRRRLRWLETTLATSRRGAGLLDHAQYGTRIRRRLTRVR